MKFKTFILKVLNDIILNFITISNYKKIDT
jgi:hypothetical protein